jgi:Xaa-Pro aminopeptidase
VSEPPDPSVDGSVDPSRLPTGLSAVRTAVDETGAVGFVHVGNRRDDDRRYLTRVDGPDRETAVVFVPGSDSREPQAVYCVPTETIEEATGFDQASGHPDGITQQIVGRGPTTATGQQVCDILARTVGETGGEQRLLVPREIPHDTAVFLQQAGYDLQSTTAIRAVRTSKTESEQVCLRAVQTAAATGLARAEAVLAATESVDEGLVFDGRSLSVERLCRLINTELAAYGVDPAANTAVESDTTGPAGQLQAGEPIQLTVTPRGPYGYHGHLTRTVVVDSEGGWERRAFVAAEAGLRAAQRHIEVGADVSTIQREAVAEVGAYGFSIGADPEETVQPAATATVHGVGLEAYEPPVQGTESKLQAGSVIAVDTGVVDPTEGRIRLGTLVVVTDEGADPLVEYPYSLTPVDRLESGK